METTTKTKQQIRFEADVRAAYAKLATGPGAWVSLTNLRSELPHIAPWNVGPALKAMYASLAGTKTMYLIPESNQKVLTEQDRRSAVTIGNEPRHLIAIHR